MTIQTIFITLLTMLTVVIPLLFSLV